MLFKVLFQICLCLVSVPRYVLDFVLKFEKEIEHILRSNLKMVISMKICTGGLASHHTQSHSLPTITYSLLDWIRPEVLSGSETSNSHESRV